MDKEEFKKIAIAIKTSFPDSNVLQDSSAMDIWFMMLSDLPYEVAQAATLEYISTNKFPPKIADIREKSSGYLNAPISDWSEAWETVLKLIRKFGYMEEMQALANMDDITRTCVKRLGYQNICMSEYITADRANFRDIYENEAKRRREQSKVPLQLQSQRRQMMEQLIESTTIQIEQHIEPSQELKTANMDKVSDMLNNLRRSNPE
jgi:hypothetical protein